MTSRYERQRLLIGDRGQTKLADASVFIAGAGGLGSPVAVYLAAAGVGHITLLDYDTVSETNLNRQFLHGVQDIGRQKAQSGAEKLRSLNPEIEIAVKTEKLTAENVSGLVGDCQIIADALDNNETRRILSQFAHETNRPFFHGAVFGWYGQFASFLPSAGSCYFCTFPDETEQNNSSDEPDNPTEPNNPAEPNNPTEPNNPAEPFPIIGTTAGIVGSMEADEIIKYITGHKIEWGCLFVWDGLTNSLDKTEILKDKNCPVCSKLKT